MSRDEDRVQAATLPVGLGMPGERFAVARATRVLDSSVNGGSRFPVVLPSNTLEIGRAHV